MFGRENRTVPSMFEGALWKQANISGLWELHSGWNFQKAFQVFENIGKCHHGIQPGQYQWANHAVFSSLLLEGHHPPRESIPAESCSLRCPITFGKPVKMVIFGLGVSGQLRRILEMDIEEKQGNTALRRVWVFYNCVLGDWIKNHLFTL